MYFDYKDKRIDLIINWKDASNIEKCKGIQGGLEFALRAIRKRIKELEEIKKTISKTKIKCKNSF